MAVTGANLEQLKQLSQEFLSDAQLIDALIPRIDAKLAAAQWTGGNATNFTNNWQSQWKPMLKSLADGDGGLRQNGNYINSQATALGQATGTSV